MSVVTKASNPELYNALFPEDGIKKILDILKKINEEYSLDTELDFEDYEIPNIYLKQFLDYITNLQEKYEEADNDRHKLFEQKEKAIEYINTHYLNANEPELLNILGDDE